MKKQTIKCYRCDKKILYSQLQYVVRIPEQMKYAAICKKCYNKRKGNALPVNKIRRSEYNHSKLEFDQILDLP